MIWDTVNILLIVFEVLFFAAGIWYISVSGKRNRITDGFMFATTVLLNLIVYLLPVIYIQYTAPETHSLVLSLVGCVSATIKQMVGECNIEQVSSYALAFPLYIYAYGGAAALAIITSFLAVITLWGARVKNAYRVRKLLNGTGYCDVVIGCSESAVKYAENNKKCVILADSANDKEVLNGLMRSGYAVIMRPLSLKLLQSRLFNNHTAYNFIRFDGRNEALSEIKLFASYLSKEKKDVSYYVEVNEKNVQTLRDQISGMYRDAEIDERIKIFSKNELVARCLNGESPITRYMPDSFIDFENSIIKNNVKLRVFMLGFGALSEEIYRQLICNNQLVTEENGKYRVIPIEYIIYTPELDEREWHIKGIGTELNEIKKEAGEYAEIPDAPYSVSVIYESHFYAEIIKSICNCVNESYSFSYFIVDTGDEYENADISKKITEKLGESDKYHLFVHDETGLSDNYRNITCYGNIESILTHDVIINDKLNELAKFINGYYTLKAELNPGEIITEDISETVEKEWKKLDWFTRNNNIYLANNLRLKLHLMGLDYREKTGETESEKNYRDIIKAHINNSGSGYDKVSPSSAMIAQEHSRWNAYHFINGYMPMKLNELRFDTEKNKVINKKTYKRLHGCLVSYEGLKKLTENVNRIYKENGSDKKADFYSFDNLLLEAAPDFLERNNYALVSRVNENKKK